MEIVQAVVAVFMLPRTIWQEVEHLVQMVEIFMQWLF